GCGNALTGIGLPRLFRVASFRFAAFYAAVFVASACLLGLAVFEEARSALRQQLEARIETETAFLLAEARNQGLSYLLATVQARGLPGRAILRRVDAIARPGEAIIEGDWSRRVPLRGTGDDLDRLGGTLNHMLDRITGLMESLRQVSSDVAHDLRTPLTRLFQ